MTTFRIVIMISCLTILSLTGFACSAPKHLSPEYGESYHEAFSSQVIDPDAPEDPSHADTLPGDIANKIYKKRYIKSMTEKEKEKEEGVGQQLRDIN